MLDEPTAMLDPRGRREVFDTVRRLNREMGITVLFVTHFMDEAVKADRVIIIDSGRLCLDGTPREVFREGGHADAITIHPRNYRPTKQMYAKILNNGLPSLGRQGIMSVSTSLLNNAAAVYGDPAIAAFAIVSRCLNFVNSTVVGFGQGFQPVCGFNYGARKYDRMHRAFSFSVKVTTIVLLVLGAAGFAFAEPVVTLFRRSDPEVIRIGTETFRVQILTVWAWGFITLSNMYTQAIGYGIRSTILAAARQGLFLIPTLLVLPNVWGLRGLEVCQPLADVLTLALAVWMMTKVIRAQKAQMAKETA